ncbi:MAG: hypothetical protein AAGJ82_06545 [Bacteroidota bacterium]
MIGIAFLGPSLLLLETWRRWGNLWSYAYFDDVLLVCLASITAFYLYRRTFTGQLLWLFTCGYATCLITDSVVATLTKKTLNDASGFPNTTVLGVKLAMYGLVILMTISAFRRLRKYRFE